MEVLAAVRSALKDECGVEADAIEMSVHVVDDLGLDSLDLLNAVFRIEKDTGVKLPFRQWLEEDYGPQPPAVSHFLVGEICSYIAENRAQT